MRTHRKPKGLPWTKSQLDSYFHNKSVAQEQYLERKRLQQHTYDKEDDHGD